MGVHKNKSFTTQKIVYSVKINNSPKVCRYSSLNREIRQIPV
uniref:Uncharacterized protein n=1 Tax=Anguilla anguilla TaxID=7936 RepID=A0A0E9SNX6_ANGAN